MSRSAAYAAVIGRLVDKASIDVVVPQGRGKSLPRYVVYEAGGSNMGLGLDGTTEAKTEVLVLVETQAGQYTTQSNQLTAALHTIFPVGLDFDGVSVQEAPDERPPLPVQDGVYSVPVYIRVQHRFRNTIAD